MLLKVFLRKAKHFLIKFIFQRQYLFQTFIKKQELGVLNFPFLSQETSVNCLINLYPP